MRILIVDPEYLVAMEAERILDQEFDCETQIEMPRDYASVLEKGGFDMVLIDSGLVVNSPEARRLLQTGTAAVIFSSLGDDEADGLAEWPGITVVPKPFDERALVNAIKNAARD